MNKLLEKLFTKKMNKYQIAKKMRDMEYRFETVEFVYSLMYKN